MKKVKYLVGLGALGAAPLVGVMMPANAAVAAPAGGPAACLPNNFNGNIALSSVNHRFDFAVRFSTPHLCVAYVSATLKKAQTSLYLRTRLYKNGVQYQAPFASGYISPFFPTVTTFSLYSIDRNATADCEALVYSYDTPKVAYGAVCTNL
jgi:hypothetical protein